MLFFGIPNRSFISQASQASGLDSRSSEVFWSPSPCWGKPSAKKEKIMRTTTVDGRNQATVTSSG